MTFKVSLKKNTLKRKGRPKFLSSITNISVSKSQDRRHILHGTIHIINILINSFNRVLNNIGIDNFMALIDGVLTDFRQRNINFLISKNASLEEKVKKVITIAFSKRENLTIGSSVHNQGIEKARITIESIKKEIDKYCGSQIRDFLEIKTKIILLLMNKTKNKSNGKVANYRIEILNILKKSIADATTILELIELLNNFEFSCTLDIINENTTKEQNIWGLNSINKLIIAVNTYNEQGIYQVLL
ncbi:MAG TPA: hypothetical protein VGA80_18340 [Flavobacteriaceae bacterium]